MRKILMALPNTQALGTSATDQLWRAGIPRLGSGPFPPSPSTSVATALVADSARLAASKELAAALAATVSDPGLIAKVIKANKHDDVARAAKSNPCIRDEDRGLLAFSTLQLASNDAPSQAWNEFLAGRVESFVAGLADDSTRAAHIEVLLEAGKLIPAGEGATSASVLMAAIPGLDEDGAAELVIDDDNVTNPWAVRRLRGHIATAAHAAGCDADREIAEYYRDNNRLVDHEIVVAIIRAINDGHAAPEDFTLSGYAAALCEVRFGSNNPFGRDESVPHVAHQKTTTASTSSDPYLSVLDILGLGDAAARLSISAGGLSDDEFVAALPQADIETIVDWAEKRLGCKPREGQVAEVIDTLDADRQAELMQEVARRPNPLDLQPELALCVPNASSLDVTDRAAIFVALTAHRILGDAERPWELAVQLLMQGWDHSVLELLRTVEALTS